jgi:hypothetical protein
MQFELPKFNARAVKRLVFGSATLLLAFTTGRLSVWLVPPSGLYGRGSITPISKPSVPLGPNAAASFAPWASKWAPPEEKVVDQPDSDRTFISDPIALERCAARYRSFDPSDGTYQPNGREGRVLCRLLR